MATGGSLSKMFQTGHESFCEFPCSLCEKEGKHVEAVRYCEECFVYMCEYCVGNHNRFPLNSRHKLLNQSQFTKMKVPALKSFPTTRCSKHPGELLNIFCKVHDVVCCSVCKALEHSDCSPTQHLPAAAKGIKLSTEYQSTKERAKIFLSDVCKTLASRKADLIRIAKEKQQVKQAIADFRKKVNKYFDDLQQKTLHELDLKQKHIQSDVDQDIMYLDTTKMKTEDVIKKVELFQGENECELFVNVKMEKHFVNDELTKVRVIAKAVRDESIQFNINPEIETYLRSVNKLGTFSDAALSSAATSATAIKRPASVSVYKRSIRVEDIDQYQPKPFGKFNVNDASDSNVCNVVDIRQMPDGYVLILDDCNNKLKRLDQSYRLIDSVKLASQPHSLCVVGSNYAAVSLCLKQKVQVFSMGMKPALINSFNTNNFCRGMVYSDGKLYVCCGYTRDSTSGHIEVYSTSGNLQFIIPRAMQNSLTAVPDRINITDDGQHLLVTSFECDDITMINLTSNAINAFINTDLVTPFAICTDCRGELFVSGYESNVIVQFAPKTKKMWTILTKADGIRNPEGICYDKLHSRLMVSCFNSNEILVFNMK